MKFFLKYYCFTVPASVLVVYLFTLAPTTIQIDSGELAAVQATLGIAHPTGYPLFTILGNLFARIPIPIDIIDKLNFLAALYCSGGLVLFMYSGKLVLANLDSYNGKEKKVVKKSSKKNKNEEVIAPVENKIPEHYKKMALTAGALILGFSRTFWMQSTSVEVYSLHILLISLVTFTLLYAFLYKGTGIWPWLLFAFSLALGFSNHMTTMLILPGAAYLFFTKHGFNKQAFKKIAFMLILFFTVLIALYAYLPVRAAQNPLLNWGNPINLERLYWHISGKQYQVWLFSSTGAAKKQLAYFFSILPSEFLISLLFCLIGMVYTFFAARKIFVFLFLSFIVTVVYSINYDIADIDSYFLLAFITLSFFAVFGIVKVFTIVKFRKQTYLIAAALIGVFVLLQVYANFGRVNQGNTYIFEDYTKAILTKTNKDSFIFSYLWDYFISPSYYFQHVENFRKDAVIVDKELLRRSWYYQQIDNIDPNVLKGVENERKLFLESLNQFEKGEKYDELLIEQRYRSLMTNMLKTNAENRQVYISPELFENEIQRGELKLPEGYTLVPDILLFKMVKGKEYIPASDPDFPLRITGKPNHYIQVIEELAGSMLVRRALYELQFDKVERAKVYIRKVKNDLPDYQIPAGIANVLEK